MRSRYWDLAPGVDPTLLTGLISMVAFEPLSPRLKLGLKLVPVA